MSAVQPLCWVSGSTLDQTVSALLAEFDAWAVAWGLPQATRCDVRIVRVPAAEGVPSGEDLLSRSEETTQALRTKLIHLLHPSLGEMSTVLELAARRLATDLLGLLRKRFAAYSAPIVPAAAPIGDWGVQATLAWQGCQLGFALSCGQLRAARLLRDAALPKLAKVSAERALSQLPVDLVAEVGRASISVPDLVNLAIDDVVVLTRGLDAPIHLSSPGSGLHQLARLGRTATGLRAVSLLATTSANASS